MLLALCDMRTLYLRNVPDDVVRRLEILAARAHTSVGAVAVRELSEVSRRADNAALVGHLPDLDVPAAELVAELDAGRSGR
jgi:plasmid stability protein